MSERHRVCVRGGGEGPFLRLFEQISSKWKEGNGRPLTGFLGTPAGERTVNQTWKKRKGNQQTGRSTGSIPKWKGAFLRGRKSNSNPGL